MVDRKVGQTPEPSRKIIGEHGNALRFIADDLVSSRGLYLMRGLRTAMTKAGVENSLSIQAIGYFAEDAMGLLKVNPAIRGTEDIPGIDVFQQVPKRDVLRTEKSRYPELRVVLDYDFRVPRDVKSGVTTDTMKAFVLRIRFAGPIEIQQYEYADGEITPTEPIPVERFEWENNPQAISRALYRVFTQHPPTRKPATE